MASERSHTIAALGPLLILSGGCARTDLSSWTDDPLGFGGAAAGPAAATAGGADNTSAEASTAGAGVGGSAANGGTGTLATTGMTAVPEGTVGGGSTCLHECVERCVAWGGRLAEGTCQADLRCCEGATPPGPRPGPEPEPSGCDCTESQVCDIETQSCRCGEGYQELPGSPGLCVADPCAGVTCGGRGICSVADDGRARCDCEGDWSGLDCNQRWHTIEVPPFVEDIAFDAAGNGWLSTTGGVLFWDFNDTPDDTADDSWQLFGPFEGYSYDFQSVVIDARGVKWVLAGRLYRLDDNGTPTHTADDTWDNYELTYWRDPGTRSIRLDGEGRLWWVGQAGTGVKVLSADDFNAGPPPVSDPKWLSLFTTEVVHDLAVGGSGVWVAAESGLYHVALGNALADETDDVWTDFSDVPALGGHAVNHIEMDPASGSVWFTTAGGIVRLSHGGDPLNEATNTWAAWGPQVAQAPVDIGPVIAVGADAAVWLRSPQGAAVRVAASEPGNDSLTFHHPSSCPQYAANPSDDGVDSLVVDERGHKWLSWGGSLLHFDDGGTATDTTDDRWTRLGRAALSENVMELFPVADGNVWLKSFRGNGTSSPGCSGTATLYYLRAGALASSLDDAWLRHPLEEELSSCFDLLGPDAAGHLWVKDQPPQRADGAWHLIDVRTTPEDPSDDQWTAWTAAEASSFSANAAVVDPVQGLWIGDYLFDYGGSLSGSEDDSWWQLDAQSPSCVALDAQGGRWFGYDAPMLRYLDDGATPELAADDSWVEYTSADGLPVDSVRDVRLDALNSLWILGNRGDEEPQLCRLDHAATPLDKSDDDWTCYTTYEGLNHPWVTSMALAPPGNVWLGTLTGLQYLELDR